MSGAYPAAAATAPGAAPAAGPREAAAAEYPDRHSDRRPDQHPRLPDWAPMRQLVKRHVGAGADPQAAEAGGPAPQQTPLIMLWRGFMGGGSASARVVHRRKRHGQGSVQDKAGTELRIEKTVSCLGLFLLLLFWAWRDSVGLERGLLIHKYTVVKQAGRCS